MPSFAELKAKAVGVTSAGVEKVQNVRDRNTSVPLKKTNWDPYNGQPPPPPPPRANPNLRPQPPLLPPPSRTGSTLSSTASRASSSSPAPPLPSRSNSSGTPPPPPLRAPSISSPALPPRSFWAGAPPAPPSGSRGPVPAGPPPIIRRSTRPDGKPQLQTPRLSPAHTEPTIDWANLSPEDKEVFFSWLDEFFAHFKQKMVVNPDDTISQVNPPLRPANTRASWSNSQTGSQSNTSFKPLSHPPAAERGSAAADLAHFFGPAIPWNDAWYNRQDGPAIPPPLQSNGHSMYTTSWTTRGPNKSVNIGVLFSDLSVFWGAVDFLTSDPENPRTTKRRAAYLSLPNALDQATLVKAHEMYNETIALFAESFLGSGQCCSRGECWDLANEALKYFNDYDYIPKPVPSISRTHGHLIYEGRATNRGKQMEGRWRGGDDRVRRGDIAEWRSVRIGRPGGYSTLGDPDHTAIIVADMIPKVSPRDGQTLSPADLGIMTVVEQSQGQLPERRDYDLSFLEEGEMWIYRPVGMEEYLGISELTAVASNGHAGLKQV